MSNPPPAEGVACAKAGEINIYYTLLIGIETCCFFEEADVPGKSV